ncbi:Trp biosynthesis-associated membrane protein [Agrococcus beijingensis]|uniref:Trp biosynthesis-associated membrane protein n=1 Tax=Agrococcus beijingensis TaxID=3068634 RepID=UPI0027417D4E|nr:Trp biosynthesis-associated membrane protein [Agrococcus sp. REN33]
MSGRVVAVLCLLAAGALGLVAATQPWAQVELADGRGLAVAGQDLAGGLAILSLACVALALVLPIAGVVWRFVLAGLAIVLGALMAVHASSAVGGIDAAVEAVVAEATGIAGAAQAAEITTRTAAPWPWLAVAAGVLAALVGVWVMITARRWPAKAQRAARYERTGSGLAWDVMDDGEDPTR